MNIAKNILQTFLVAIVFIVTISVLIAVTYVSFWILLSMGVLLVIVGLFKALQARDKYV